MNTMYYNDDLSIYSGQANELNLKPISERPKSKSSTVTLNDELLSVLSELSVSPKTKSTHIYLSALLPSVLCILVSCVFVIAILCHRKRLFKSKYKSNKISRILHNPTYCDQHSSCNVTVGDNNSHEIGYQSDIQTNHSYSSKLVKNPLPEWVNGKNLITHLQPLQQTNNSNVRSIQYCPSCNNDQKEIPQLYHYQNISYGDNEVISNGEIPNQSVKASPNSNSQLASTENSFTPNSIGIINKMDDIYPSSATCLSGAFVNNSVKHQNQCYSLQFNHTNSLVFGNYATNSNNSSNNNNNSQQTNTWINDQISNEQENISKLNYYYDDDDGKIIPNIHAELHDASIYEHEESTSDSHQKLMNTNPNTTSVNLKEQMNCKVKTRLAPPLFSSGDDLLPNYMMNTKSPVHLKYGVIPVVRYPYDSDHSDNSDSESQKYLKTKEALNYSRHYGNKPDICLTVNKNEINKEFLVSTSPTTKTSHPKCGQISRTASDHRVQNPVSPSLIRSVTSQLTNNSTSSFVKISKPFTKTICTIQPTNVLNDIHNSEHHIQSSAINVKNKSLIYDSNKLSPFINREDVSNSMCRSIQP
ncbi:asparagine-rich protein [Schistosoma japonicum]|nr:asparagine-rich protein [Schistosoma japonicum]